MQKLIPWLGVVVIILLIFGTIFTVTQQAGRAAANSPQIQIAEDAAAQLNRGDHPLIVTSGQMDIEASLAPFTIVYDKSGKVVSGSGYIRGKVPKAPMSILAAAKGRDYNAVTWEPKDGVRIAAVTVAADKYYVLSGRSLKLAEKQANTTLLLSALGCLASLVVVGVLYVVARTLPA
jgi:hypothetical protein